MKKKTIVVILAAMLVFGVAMGATIAYLTSETETVKNTFTVGDIEITLTESQINETGTGLVSPDTQVTTQGNNKYKVIPGSNIDFKNPRVTFTVDSEPCWLFVKIETNDDWTDSGLGYEVAEGWTALPNVSGVYYKELTAAADTAENTQYFILKDNTITVPAALTNTQLEKAKTAELKFTAYAIQHENLSDATAAWNALDQ